MTDKEIKLMLNLMARSNRENSLDQVLDVYQNLDGENSKQEFADTTLFLMRFYQYVMSGLQEYVKITSPGNVPDC